MFYIYPAYLCVHTWVYHLDAMFQGDLDDLVSSQVCSHRCVLASLSNHVCLISLYLIARMD